MRLTAWRRVAIMAALVAWPLTAEAHSPIKGLGAFYGHMLHPLAVPAHAMLLIAIALMLGQSGRDAARAGLPAFALGLFAGLATAGTGAVTGVRESILLFGALAAASAVSLALRVPSVIAALAAGVAGFGLGLDSAPSDPASREAMVAYAGLIAGTLWLVTIVAGMTVGLSQPWRRVGVRVAGSWIAAVAALGLAFALAGPHERDIAAKPCPTEGDRQC